LALLPFTKAQKAQLGGWINRENDHLLSLRALSREILIPEITGTLELIQNDLEFTVRVRDAIRGTTNDDPIEISESDIETLIDIGRGNKYPNRVEFWKSVVEVCERGDPRRETLHRD
jgi:hypothetical protein